MRILFICTHNRCRSIMSEAITNRIAGDRIDVKSAGSKPAGVVHPLSLHYLLQAGYPTEGLQSQSWNDFAGFNPDVVITVCNSAAEEECPLYLGGALRVHWGLSDPSKEVDSQAKQESGFLECIHKIEQRAEKLREVTSLNLTGTALHQALLTIGEK
ncbi:MAG: arsenate reductase ArsC [Pseudohongiellaceae bacterium]